MAPGRGSSGGREEEQARCADGWARFCLKGQFRSWEDDIPPPQPCLGSRARTDPEAAGSFRTTIPSRNPQQGHPDERGRFSPYIFIKRRDPASNFDSEIRGEKGAHTPPPQSPTPTHKSIPTMRVLFTSCTFPPCPCPPPPLLLAFIPLSALEKNLILRGDDATRRKGEGRQGERGSKRHI